MFRSGFRAALLAAVASLGLAHAAQARPVVEVAFVLDTTGSMANLIEGAKRKIWSIATTILDANPDAELRMALIAYRDIGDEYVTKVFPLTTDIQEIYARLLALRAQGGGDWPESVNEALDKAVTGLSWSQEARDDRIVFLVGDAPPHMDYKQDRKYPAIVADARARAIVVNAVQAGAARDTERVWREIAQRGGGRYIPIPQDGGEIVVIETPYDEEIVILQKRINETIIPYGDHSRQDAVRKKADQIKAASPSTASDLAGYMSRAGKGREAVTGEGDLVADVTQGRRKLESVPVDQLPAPMQSLDAQARRAYLDRREAERAELSKKMAELVARRDAFTREKREAMLRAPGARKDSFDATVSETLRAQIRR
ncbi:MAG: VWA domain-containing protein [Methylobacteriaceae bacterium]|nr:VWA domain-containing protein [Methylobacteriaceae bacterium]